MTLPKIPIIENPVLADKVIAHAQNALFYNLGWLDHSFGRAQYLETTKSGLGDNQYFTANQYENTKRFPGIFIDGLYYNMLPNEEFGNYCFFIVHDPQEIKTLNRSLKKININFSLIFWYNLESITDQVDRNTEVVKLQVLEVLSQNILLNRGRIVIDEVVEKGSEIYKEFDISEINSQHYMHPYAGLRINGTISYDSFCDTNIMMVDGEPIIYKDIRDIEQLVADLKEYVENISILAGAKSWFDYLVSCYTNIKIATIPTGDVYKLDFGTYSYYRLVPNDGNKDNDNIYRDFDGINLIDIIQKRITSQT